MAEPSATEPRRAPQKKLTEADKLAIIETCRREDVKKPDGSIDISLVARLTGKSYGCVERLVGRDPYLRTLRAEANPEKLIPRESELIDTPRAPQGIIVTQEEFDRAQALLRQQRIMTAGDWEQHGMTPDMAQRLEKMNRMGKVPLLHLTQMAMGGLLKDVANLDEILDGDAEKIKGHLLPAETDKEGMPVEDGKVQREWRYNYYAGIKLRLEIFNSMQKTQAMLVRVMKDMQAAGMNGKPAEKGVFSAQVSERPADHDRD